MRGDVDGVVGTQARGERLVRLRRAGRGHACELAAADRDRPRRDRAVPERHVLRRQGARAARGAALARPLARRGRARGRVADRLEAEFEPWTDPAGCVDRDARCFVYDDALRLVVGRTPSFGSEEGNDHHFHYGYFLAAAAALAEARPELVDTLAPVMDALAADIAAGAADAALPALRVFDPYRGHSWASGLRRSPRATTRSPAPRRSRRGTASRSGRGRAATRAWKRRPRGCCRPRPLPPARCGSSPTSTTSPTGYEHGIVSLTWGGKRDYATWFSAEPSAILGIQILPVGPISLDYLAGSPERVAANVAEAGGDAAFAVRSASMSWRTRRSRAPASALDAEEIARGLDAEGLDDGTSLLGDARVARGRAPGTGAVADGRRDPPVGS